MPQIEVEVIKAQKEGNVIHLEILWQGQRISRSVTASKVSTPEALARWLLAQTKPNQESNEAIRRKLTIDFHNAGEGPVLDNVTVQKLDEEAAVEAIANLPGWATWDGQQAEDWIETNVTSLATVKTALKALARLVIAERDVIKKLVERVGI